MSFAMSLTVEIYPVMPTRPCSFCLCLQGGSVFADFDTDGSDSVSLHRISFDGFGCCRVDGLATKMNHADSKLLLDSVASGRIETAEVEDALLRYFRDNSNVIWDDALSHHELL
jgi:hypothetical protein